MLRQSRFPEEIGKCATDAPAIFALANHAQQILINAGGETGWFGGWARVIFTVSRCNPFISLPRAFQRAIGLDVCRTPIRVQNEFYEFLEAGVGLKGLCNQPDWCGALEGYERGVFPTMTDVASSNQLLRVYITDPRDITKRILIGPSLDQNGNPIYTQDGNNPVNGFYLTFSQPFTTSSFIVTSIGGIQKDLTYGDVLLYQVDATTGTQVLLSRYAPDEITPAYRRYYINRLPCSCGSVVSQSPCIAPASVPSMVPVTAMAKLEFIPVMKDTDFLIIGNIPALIEEAKSIRFANMDNSDALKQSAFHHAKAIKLLNQELSSYLGREQPAINFAPFGTAKFRRVMSAVNNG